MGFFGNKLLILTASSPFMKWQWRNRFLTKKGILLKYEEVKKDNKGGETRERRKSFLSGLHNSSLLRPSQGSPKLSFLLGKTGGASWCHRSSNLCHIPFFFATGPSNNWHSTFKSVKKCLEKIWFCYESHIIISLSYRPIKLVEIQQSLKNIFLHIS